MTNPLEIKSEPGEEVIYKKDITKGFWHPKVVSAYLITNYRVISPDGQMLWHEEIDDVISINQRRESTGNFQMMGTRGGSFRYYMGNTRGKGILMGDIHFMSSVKHDLIWQSVTDPNSLVKLVKSLKKQRQSSKK